MSDTKLSDEDWDEAISHLRTKRDQYEEIGDAGVFALNATIRPLLQRYESGERTEELYEEMMAVE